MYIILEEPSSLFISLQFKSGYDVFNVKYVGVFERLNIASVFDESFTAGYTIPKENLRDLVLYGKTLVTGENIGKIMNYLLPKSLEEFKIEYNSPGGV